SVPTAALTRTERRTISVVLVGAAPALEGERTRVQTHDETLDGHSADVEEALRKGAEAWGGRLTLLRDGSAAVSISGADVATDQVARAARCALWLRGRVGDRGVALSTGRRDSTAGAATGEAIDRAAQLLASHAGEGGGGVAIDETTARL